MIRTISLCAVLTVLLAIPASHLVWGKGHVRIGKVQVCHKGEVLTVSENALRAHLKHGDCQLPACDFNNVFQTGDACEVSNGGGRCELADERDPADGVTPGCPEGTF